MRAAQAARSEGGDCDAFFFSGTEFERKVPLRWIRLPVAGLFLIGGFIVAVRALGLV